MPINADPNQQNTDQTGVGQQQANTAGGQANPSTGGGASGAPASGGGAPESRVANYSNGTSPNSSGSGRFTNIQKYIGANDGSGQYLTNRISNNLTNQTNNYADSKDLNTINQNVSAAQGNVAKAGTYAQQLGTDPTQITANANDTTNFQNLYNNVGQSGDLRTQAQNLQAQKNTDYNSLTGNINNLGSENGRFQLLQNTIKTPGYSAGQQQLDQLMLQSATPAGYLNSVQQQLANQANTAHTQQGTDFTNALNSINTLGTDEGNAYTTLHGAWDDANTNFNDSIQKQLTDLNTTRAANATALTQGLSNGFNTLTDDQKKYMLSQINGAGLNLNSNTYNLLDGKGYNNYITTGTQLNNAAGGNFDHDVFNQNQLNQYDSLATLAGLNDNQRLYNAVGNSGVDSGLKGTQLSADINSAKTALQQALNHNYTNDYYSGGQYASGNNTTANGLDFVNWLEGNKNNGTGYYYSPDQTMTGVVSHPDFGNDYAAPVYQTNNGHTDYTAQDGMTYAGNESGINVLDQIYSQLANAGYFDALGNGASGNGFSVANRNNKESSNV